MKRNFYILCCIIFIITYFLMLFQKSNNPYMKKLTRKLINIKLKDEEDQKIKILYNIILIAITLSITVYGTSFITKIYI